MSAIHINPKHEGKFHEDMGVAKGKPIPASKLMEGLKSNSPAVRKRANFARMAKRGFKPLG